MGLGASPMVVGDAGVTVARRAPCPSPPQQLSASARCGGARRALRMDLRPAPGQGRVSSRPWCGATGAIGSACARLLCAPLREEVYLGVAETAKLLALKDSILKETPDAKVHLAARADKDVAEMDMIGHLDLGRGKKVPGHHKVKPGCGRSPTWRDR